MKKRLLPLIIALGILICSLSFASTGTYAADEFKDVADPTASYYKPVYWAVDAGIAKGYPADNTFRPANDCTRSQFVTFIWRMAGRPSATSSENPFSDVNSGMSAYRAILWAVEEGIIRGYNDGTFRPKESVLRRQVAVMLWRMAGRPETGAARGFPDVTAADSCYRAVMWGSATGVIRGSNGLFKPADPCLRRQIVTFLYRYVRDISNGGVYSGWGLDGRNPVYYREGKRVTGEYVDGLYLDENGIASGDLEDLIPLQAKLIGESITDRSMSYDDRIRAAFDYVQKEFASTSNPRIPHYKGLDWPLVYANDMFSARGGGNCFSFAASFAYLAKGCGAKEVYARNSGGHAWVEIDGLIYDPEQYHDTDNKVYGIAYGDNSYGINYEGAIASWKDVPWMRVKIPEL